MANKHLIQKTKEEMLEMQALGRASRAAKVASWEQNKHLLKHDWLDSGHWKELGSKYKIVFPNHLEPLTEARLRKYLRKIGVVDEWDEHYGKVRSFIALNPTVPLWASVGQALELKDM